MRSEAIEEKAGETGTESQENASATAEATAENTESEVDLEKAKRDAERMIAWEKKNAPTVNELNKVREYVKGFDNLPDNRRMAIIRMMRSSQGVDAKTVKSVANLMAIQNNR